jgi:hypothetical protein
MIRAFLVACGGESKKKFVGTPHSPAKDFVLCTPFIRDTFHLDLMLVMCEIMLFKKTKKADKTFVDRDEVASMLRGTTHFEPA